MRIPALPSATAMARPTRVPAPVTSATLPSRSTLRSLDSGRRRSRRQSFVLFFEPGEWNVHVAKFARTLRRAVPIGTAADHQTKIIGQSLQALHIISAVTRVLDFHAIESGVDERFESLSSSAFGRVRPDRQSASFVRDLDRVFNR